MQASVQRDQNTSTVFRLPKAVPLLIVIELAIVVIVALIIARPYTDFRENYRIAGNEAEYLQSSVTTAWSSFRRLGYLPLWQPWLEKGEPLLSSPFSMILNPMSSWPGFFLGGNNGLKFSMILTLVFSGLGGWVLARVLGLRSAARVLLGVLCIARGSMHGVLAPGFFPFTMSQSYFPWIFVGVIGILWFRKRRWPIVLTALMFNLMFWVGLMWYVPAITLAIAMLALIHIVSIRLRDENTHQFAPRLSIDWILIRRMFFTAVFTLGLSAATLIPLVAFNKYFGTSTILYDPPYNMTTITDLYFNPIPKTEFEGLSRGAAFYAYISPWWYIGLLSVGVVLVSLMRRSRKRPAYARTFVPIVIVMLLLIVFYTFWGGGQNPLIEWSYSHIPLANLFRHVERVLAVGAFFISIVIACAADYIWFQLRHAAWWTNTAGQKPLLMKAAQFVLAFGLLLASGNASANVLNQWYVYGPALELENPNVDRCLTWLRTQYSGEPLSVWTLGYTDIDNYLKYEIRHSNIITDFYKPAPLESTIYRTNISESSPRYAQPWGDWKFDYMKALNYQQNPDLPMDTPERPCFFDRDSYYSYAFSIQKSQLTREGGLQLTPEMTMPITSFQRNYDVVAVVVNGDPGADQVLVAGELAFPGWTVKVNGKPAKLEIFGGYISAVLPAAATQYQVLFQYRPPEFFTGAAITLATWLFCILFLLHIKIRIPKRVLEEGEKHGRKLITALMRPWWTSDEEQDALVD